MTDSTLEWRIEIAETLAELVTNTSNIVQRLDRLNGSVARHEQRLGESDSKFAALAATKTESAVWQKRLQPLMLLALTFFVGLVLGHADLLKSLVAK